MNLVGALLWFTLPDVLTPFHIEKKQIRSTIARQAKFPKLTFPNFPILRSCVRLSL